MLRPPCVLLGVKVQVKVVNDADHGGGDGDDDDDDESGGDGFAFSLFENMAVHVFSIIHTTSQEN